MSKSTLLIPTIARAAAVRRKPQIPNTRGPNPKTVRTVTSKRLNTSQRRTARDVITSVTRNLTNQWKLVIGKRRTTRRVQPIINEYAHAVELNKLPTYAGKKRTTRHVHPLINGNVHAVGIKNAINV